MSVARRLVVFVMVFCSVLNICVVSSYACDAAPDGMSEEELLLDVRYWKQGIVPFTGDEPISDDKDSSTIERAACSHFAMAYALVKMGIFNPFNGDTPMTQIENARKHNAFKVDWGYFWFAKVNDIYKGVSHVKTRGLREKPIEDALKSVKNLVSKGYYVIACVSTEDTGGHMIFFDSFNSDGTISIGDSYFKGTTWDSYYGKKNTKIEYIEVLSCEGKPCNEQPSIYDVEAHRRSAELSRIVTTLQREVGFVPGHILIEESMFRKYVGVS